MSYYLDSQEGTRSSPFIASSCAVYGSLTKVQQNQRQIRQLDRKIGTENGNERSRTDEARTGKHDQTAALLLNYFSITQE